jgi:hypothetical protein
VVERTKTLNSKRLVIALLALVLFATVVPNSLAQQLTGTIRGTVADSTGAVVPDAKVTATNTQTQISTTVPSKADGTFEFIQLPVGTYDVSVTRSGFKAFAEKGIQLALDQVFSLPVTLQVGQVSESVQVEANAVQVETTTTQLSTVIQSQTIVDLPLNGRNWVQLQQLAPGVVSSSDRFGSNYATNGSQSQQNAYLINGADSNDLPLNTPLIIPSPDAIAEFNLIDSTMNAEYGRNSGATLNAIIKSGTNSFHGSAFEFYRDTFLDGRNLFQIAKPVYHQNQFGGTVGGPVWKDHTFFFLSYQGTRYRQPESGGQVPVPTQAQRNGTFTDLGTASATAVSPFAMTGSNGQVYPAGTPYRTIFAGNTIPSVDFNPLAVKLLSAYVPLANSPGNIYSFNPIVVGQTDQGIFRLDHTFNQKNTLWVTGFIQTTPSNETLPFTGATVPGFGDQSVSASKTFSADYTHTFSPTTLNELRLSYVRLNLQTVEPQQVVLPSSLGFNITPQNSAAAGAPFISVTGYFSLGFSTNGPQPRIDQTREVADNLSKIVGSHTLKVGFDGKRYDVDNPFNGRNNGSYTFGGGGKYSTGDPMADFLLGIPDSYSQGSGSVIVARTYESYVYAQDSWRVRNNLTLNYGVAWQVDTPLQNKYFGGLAFNCFRPGQQSSVFPTAPNGLLFPGDKSCTGSGYSTYWKDVGPRFGFAWTPSGKTGDQNFVIRGGAGLYYNRVEEELTLQNLGAVPFSLSSTGIGDIGGNPSFANPWQDIATGQTIPNKYPFTPASKGQNVNFAPYFPLSINTIDPNFRPPYAINYNLNVQRQLTGSMLMQLAYVGALGRHLEIDYEGNPISPAGEAACAATPACITNRAQQHVKYPSHALYEPGNIFASVGTQATDGVSSYNSFQASLNKRLSHGLQLQASYTYSHSIDDSSGFENSGLTSTRGVNPFNFASNKGDSAFDARQRLVVSYDYELPHLSRFWNNVLVRTALDGWHIAGITTLQSGFPILISDSGAYRSLSCDSSSYYACWDTPNVMGGTPQTYDPRTSSLVNTSKTSTNTAALPYYYFNPNVFALEPFGIVGNEGRNNFHGPGINNTDLDLTKRVYLTSSERRWLELRLEAYNAFNHTQFSATSVTGSINSTNFGRVLSAATARTIQLGAKFYF